MAAPTRLRVLVDDLPPPKSRIDAQVLRVMLLCLVLLLEGVDTTSDGVCVGGRQAFQLQVLWFGEEFTVTRTLAQFQELRSQVS